MSDLWLTGDDHFNHMNKFGGIIKYCNRPFDNIKQHNECLMDNWNDRVGLGDTVIIDGDFSFASVRKTKEILKRLNGKKIMVLGDHDKQMWQCKEFFEEITQRKFITVNNQLIVINHWASRVWKASHYNSFHAYAHSHGKLPPIGKSWDVGVDNNNFYPLNIDEFFSIMDNRPDNPNYIKNRKRKFKVGQRVILNSERVVNMELYERNKNYIGEVIGYGSKENVVQVEWPLGCYLSLHWNSNLLKEI